MLNKNEQLQNSGLPCRSDAPKTAAPARRAQRPTNKSAATKERIYRVAIELMAKNGVQATAIRDICGGANVSIGTFYSYFKTKNDVLKELYLSADKFFYKFVASEINGKEFNEQLKTFVFYYAKLNTETGLDMLQVLYTPQNEWFARTRPMQDVLARIISQGQADGVVRMDVPAEKITAYIFTTMRGVCYEWCVSEGQFDMEHRMLDYLDLIVDGIRLHDKI